MKKVLNLISLIVLIVGVSLAAVALVFADADTMTGYLAGGNQFTMSLVAVFLFAGALLSRLKGVAAKLGRGFLLAAAVVFVGLGLYPMLTAAYDARLYELLGLVGGALVLLHFIFVILADKAAETDEDVVVDEKIALIYRYKDLMDDGIITKEEFNAKKAELMAPPAKAKR